MTKQHFSFQEVFMFSWTKTKQHAWFITLTFIIAGIIIGAVRFMPVFDTVVGLMVALSIISISILISRDSVFTFSDLYTPLLSPKRVLKFIALTILYVVSVTIGTILLIIPGVYIATRFKFFPYMAIEHENATIKDLIKMSYKLTENHFWIVLGFLILATILNIIGALLFVVGLIITVPVTLFASAHMYNKLKEHNI